MKKFFEKIGAFIKRYKLIQVFFTCLFGYAGIVTFIDIFKEASSVGEYLAGILASLVSVLLYLALIWVFIPNYIRDRKEQKRGELDEN